MGVGYQCENVVCDCSEVCVPEVEDATLSLTACWTVIASLTESICGL